MAKEISTVDVRADFHIHLGKVYSSSHYDSREVITTVDDVYNFIEKCKLTHAIIIYTDIQEYRELRKRVSSSIKLYPIKWVLDPNNYVLNEETVGVKIHHVRGTVENENLFKDYDSREVAKFLKSLPDGYLVCPHFQGASKVIDGSRPLAIARQALRNPNLKFIMYHSGNFGLNSYYPPKNTVHADKTFIAMSAEIAVFEACLAAEKIPNVYLECSLMISPSSYKVRHLIKHLNKFSFGSDFPFIDWDAPGRIVPQQEKLIMRAAQIDEVEIQNIHKRSIEWLES